RPTAAIFPSRMTTVPFSIVPWGPTVRMLPPTIAIGGSAAWAVAASAARPKAAITHATLALMATLPATVWARDEAGERMPEAAMLRAPEMATATVTAPETVRMTGTARVPAAPPARTAVRPRTPSSPWRPWSADRPTRPR